LILNRSLVEFAEQVSGACSLQDAFDLFLRELSDYGVTHAKYGFTCFDPLDAPDLEILMFGEMCDEWETAHRGTNWFQNDALVAHCLTSTDPLPFSELYRRMDDGALTPGQMRNHVIGREIGMNNGVAFGIRDDTPLSTGGISMEASRDIPEADFDRLLQDRFFELQTLTELFHANVHRPKLLEPSRHPSPRERECLLWVMQGLRTDQIAFKLGTHPKTIEKQLGNVRRKLKAKTNAQAAVRALVLGLVSP